MRTFNFNRKENELLKQVDSFYEKLNNDERKKYERQCLTIAVVDEYNREMLCGGIIYYFDYAHKMYPQLLSTCLNEINALKNKKHFDDFIKSNEIDLDNFNDFLYSDSKLSNEIDTVIKTFDNEFNKILIEENLEDLLYEYAKKNFSKIFSDFDKKIDIKKLDINEFVNEYEKLAFTASECYINDNPTLNGVLNKKYKQFGKLSNRIKLNDDFAHAAIDKLMKSTDSIVLCEISCMACIIGYKKNEAIKIINKNLYKIDNPAWRHHIKLALSELCGITLDK